MGKGHHGIVGNGPGAFWERPKWLGGTSGACETARGCRGSVQKFGGASGMTETASGHLENVRNSQEVLQEHSKQAGDASGASKTDRGHLRII